MKEELHSAKLRRAEAHANYAELEDYMKRTMEAPLPGEGRIDIERIHKILITAMRMANYEERANKQQEAA